MIDVKKIFVALLLFPLVSCYQTERNCTDFKTGTFQFTYTQDGEEKVGKFLRTDDYSIEYYDDKIDTSTVRWINDCEFITKKLHPTNKNEEKALHMKILSTNENSYTFEYKYAIESPNKKQLVIKGVDEKIK